MSPARDVRETGKNAPDDDSRLVRSDDRFIPSSLAIEQLGPPRERAEASPVTIGILTWDQMSSIKRSPNTSFGVFGVLVKDQPPGFASADLGRSLNSQFSMVASGEFIRAILVLTIVPGRDSSHWERTEPRTPSSRGMGGVSQVASFESTRRACFPVQRISIEEFDPGSD